MEELCQWVRRCCCGEEEEEVVEEEEQMEQRGEEQLPVAEVRMFLQQLHSAFQFRQTSDLDPSSCWLLHNTFHVHTNSTHSRMVCATTGSGWPHLGP